MVNVLVVDDNYHLSESSTTGISFDKASRSFFSNKYFKCATSA